MEDAVAAESCNRSYLYCRHHSQKAKDGGQEEEESESEPATGVPFAFGLQH